MTERKFGYFLNYRGRVCGPNEPIIYVSWCRSSRDCIITERAIYVDPNGTIWEVCRGDVINGLSIPRFLWSLCWPYEERTREASAFHDVYCGLRSSPSPEVHKMFYNAMRANGASAWTAYLRYIPVRLFGPKFE